MSEPGEELHRLTFRPLPSDVPVAIRIRRLLKYAGRALRLRNVLYEVIEPESEKKHEPPNQTPDR